MKYINVVVDDQFTDLWLPYIDYHKDQQIEYWNKLDNVELIYELKIIDERIAIVYKDSPKSMLLNVDVSKRHDLLKIIKKRLDNDKTVMV